MRGRFPDFQILANFDFVAFFKMESAIRVGIFHPKITRRDISSSRDTQIFHRQVPKYHISPCHCSIQLCRRHPTLLNFIRLSHYLEESARLPNPKQCPSSPPSSEPHHAYKHPPSSAKYPTNQTQIRPEHPQQPSQTKSLQQPAPSSAPLYPRQQSHKQNSNPASTPYVAPPLRSCQSTATGSPAARGKLS